MERMPSWKRTLATLIAVLVPPFTMIACLGIQPKNLGQSSTLNFNQFNATGSSVFQFNFALAGTVANGDSTIMYLQGQTASQGSLVGTCNYNGTGCYCTYYDANNNNLGVSSSISYDDVGNYYRCVVPAGVTIANIATVTMANISNTITSNPVQVYVLPGVSSSLPTLTVGQLIGTDLDANRVRHVYQYSCLYNFLQKQGTTATYFDCSNQTTTCGSGGNFCLLQTTYPFYLYADTYGSNMSTMPVDELYNNTGTGELCSSSVNILQIKQFDCATPGAPTVDFGLYDQPTGMWQSAINLPAGPNEASTNYGYAAAVSTVTGLCPPGLVPEDIYTATINTALINPTSNFPSGMVATQVSSPSAIPAALSVSLVSGGTCNGTTCSLPASGTSTLTSQAYAVADEPSTTTPIPTFCVVPANMLP